jgi:predicted TIM-barrel fold metal-dependent hydrolase
MAKIWANSADSHLLEPPELWDALPDHLSRRVPRTRREGAEEIIEVDGQVIERKVPSPRRREFHEATRPPGAFQTDTRLQDLDEQGIWAEICFPSLGFWIMNVRDPELAEGCCRVWNDWAKSEVIDVAPDRLYPPAAVSMLDTDHAVAELERAAAMGFRSISLAPNPPEDRPFNSDVWEPVWDACEANGVFAAFHIGAGLENKVVTRGPGGAVINYVETTYPGMRTVTHLVASGVLDRHPGLKALIAEGGGSWVPALADRMDEAYRQHGMFVTPTLSELPSVQMYRQVYASFQHDVSAIATNRHQGYANILWGSDYPHLEGTFPDTQEVLHELFDDQPDEVRRRITVEAFNDLIPAPPPPA